MSEASTFTGGAPAASNVNATLNANISDDHSSTSTDTKVDDLFYTYEEEMKHPYVADYLEIPEIWNKEPDLKQEVKYLESYLRSQVVDKKLENNVKAAKKFLEHMEEEAGIKPFENANRRIVKLLKYIEFRKVIDG